MKCTVTIEDVKKESLKLLGATLSDDISSQSIPALIEKDDTYAQYLLNMDESINRALTRIVNEGKLPEKTFSIVYSEENQDGVVVNGSNMFITLEKCASDFRELIKIDFVTSRGDIVRDVEYGILGEEILLPCIKEGERYVFSYKYAPPMVSPLMPLSEKARKWQEVDMSLGDGGNYGAGAYNKNTLGIPDELANIIPKFVFGELYLHDDPTVAMYQGTNQFEAYLADYKPARNMKQNRIRNILEGFN